MATRCLELTDADGRNRLPANGEDGRVGEAGRVTFALINLKYDVQGEPSAHLIIVPELNGKKIACAIKCAGHDAQSDGIIDLPDAARWGHFALPTALGNARRAGHLSLSSEKKMRAASPLALRISGLFALSSD
jgi:hypothetical protein